MSAGFVCNQGFIVPQSTLKKLLGVNFQKFLDKLTLTQQSKIGPQKRVRLWSETKLNGLRCVVLPRTKLKAFSKILDHIKVLYDPVRHIKADFCITLFENQQLLCDYLLNLVYTTERLLNGTSACMLNLRAGMGKTFVAAKIISALKLPTLYIVPKRPLMLQAVKDLRTCFYNEENTHGIKIGAFGKNKKNDRVEDQDVTVIVINSALELDAQFYDRYSFVVFDEVHAYCSESRRKIFRKCSLRAVLGMTATSEDRNDGLDPIVHHELAFDGIIRAENIAGFSYDDTRFNATTVVVKYNGPAQYTQNLKHESTGHIFTHYMHNQYINDPYRVRVAVNELIELYDWRGENNQIHNIYVFAEELSILKKARDAFISALKMRNREDVSEDLQIEDGLEMFTGGLNDERVVKITKTARVLFSTFGYAATGISITKMSAILLLTPRKANMKQCAARILRRNSDTSIPRVVVDIVDNKTALKYQFGARKLAYEHYGFNIVEKKINWHELP